MKKTNEERLEELRKRIDEVVKLHPDEVKKNKFIPTPAALFGEMQWALEKLMEPVA